MKKFVGDFGLVLFLILALAGAFWYLKQKNYTIKSPIAKKVAEITEKPLEKYTFENLRKTKFDASEITLGDIVKTDNDKIVSRKFYYYTQDPKDHDKKYKVSGLMNEPKEQGEYPIIVMFRGFVEQDQYAPGVGTSRAGQVFAENGYVTLAPDFLGYGESDMPSKDSIEERFQTYPTTLSLLASLKNLNKALDKQCHEEVSETPTPTGSKKSAKVVQEEKICITADDSKVGIWGHSNGGHIAIATLELSGGKYPTVLWNPVTKPFPYSILYFTDEYDDEGKALRKVVADFENDYDILKYSPAKYYDWIQAPIQLHQGEADESVPLRWSDQFDKVMKDKDKDIEYFTYPGADHNLMPTGWNTAVNRSMDFYKKEFEKN